MNEKPFGFATHPSVVDHRDHKDTSLALGFPLPNKQITDISSLGMRMQYQIGKCVGESTAKRCDHLRQSDSPFSDDFIYLGTKKLIDQNNNEGTSIRSSLKFLQKYGVCKKSTFSVPVNQGTTYEQYSVTEIPQSAFSEAINYKIGQYIAIPIDIDVIKAAIVKYGVLVCRFDIGKEWWTPSWSASDIMPLKSPQQVISGHAAIIYGYEVINGKTLLYISNSWSGLWGDHGNGTLYFEEYNPHLTEAFAITLNPIPVDNTPAISDQVVILLINILKKLGLWYNTSITSN